MLSSSTSGTRCRPLLVVVAALSLLLAAAVYPRRAGREEYNGRSVWSTVPPETAMKRRPSFSLIPNSERDSDYDAWPVSRLASPFGS
eukprot:1770465-Prymnesium_polylepis.1